MAEQFQVTPSNVRSRIDSVAYQANTGQVIISVSIWESRVQTSQLILAQYKLSGGNWTNMTVSPDGLQLNKDIHNPGRWQQHTLIWDAFEDVDLTAHNDVQVQVQFQDADGTADDIQLSTAFDMDLTPIVASIVRPVTFGKDTMPAFEFEVPSSFSPCNMHFQLTISPNENMSNPVQTIDSSADQTGWEFQIDGVYQPMLSSGCPDISALAPGATCKHTLQTPLAAGTYYFEIKAMSVNKRLPMDQLDLTPEQMDGYPCNY